MPGINSVLKLPLPTFTPGHAVIATANAARDGTGTMGTVVTSPSTGMIVEVVRGKATGTTTAGMIRLFLHDGTNARLYKEIPVSAIVPSGTVESFEFEFVPLGGLILPPGWSLRASTHNAEEFAVRVSNGGEY